MSEKLSEEMVAYLVKCEKAGVHAPYQLVGAWAKRVATLERQLAATKEELADVLGEAQMLAMDCGEMNTADDYAARRRRILGEGE